jgi:antitoxin component YwqK of YwqJK toxin-antitoxin module
MCLHKQIHSRQSENPEMASCTHIRASLLVVLFVFTLLNSILLAQAKAEEYLMVKAWQLPTSAIARDELELSSDVLYQDGKPYDGWVYELYPDGTLLRASHYKNGLQHGLSMLWYPDGAPQMSASYRESALHGRFLGWYQDGGLIYDMYINRGTYAADNLIDTDQDRHRDEIEIQEREGSTNDSTGE